MSDHYGGTDLVGFLRHHQKKYGYDARSELWSKYFPDKEPYSRKASGTQNQLLLEALRKEQRPKDFSFFGDVDYGEKLVSDGDQNLSLPSNVNEVPPYKQTDYNLHGAVADTNRAILGTSGPRNFAVDTPKDDPMLTGTIGQGSEYVKSSGTNINPIVAQANAGSPTLLNIETSNVGDTPPPVPFQNANRDVGSNFGGGAYPKGYRGVTSSQRGPYVPGYATPLSEQTENVATQNRDYGAYVDDFNTRYPASSQSQDDLWNSTLSEARAGEGKFLGDRLRFGADQEQWAQEKSSKIQFQNLIKDWGSQKTGAETANNLNEEFLGSMQGRIEDLSGMNQGYLNAQENVANLQASGPRTALTSRGMSDSGQSFNDFWEDESQLGRLSPSGLTPNSEFHNSFGFNRDQFLGGQSKSGYTIDAQDSFIGGGGKVKDMPDFGTQYEGLKSANKDIGGAFRGFGLDPTGENPATKPSWVPLTPNVQDQFALNTEFGDLGAQAAIDAPAKLSMMNKLKFAGAKINKSLEGVGGASNVAGGVMMAGGNLMARSKYSDAIGDVDEALGEIPSMIGQTLSEAGRQVSDARDIMKSGVESSRDLAGGKLELSLQTIADNPKNVVGNVRQTSNVIRRTLQEGIDNTVSVASDKLQESMSAISEEKRDSLSYVESMREELKGKKTELEKEKKQAGIGVAVGVGSIFADALLPGSGAVLRTGWNQYSSRT